MSSISYSVLMFSKVSLGFAPSGFLGLGVGVVHLVGDENLDLVFGVAFFKDFFKESLDYVNKVGILMIDSEESLVLGDGVESLSPVGAFPMIVSSSGHRVLEAVVMDEISMLGFGEKMNGVFLIKIVYVNTKLGSTSRALSEIASHLFVEMLMDLNSTTLVDVSFVAARNGDTPKDWLMLHLGLGYACEIFDYCHDLLIECQELDLGMEKGKNDIQVQELGIVRQGLATFLDLKHLMVKLDVCLSTKFISKIEAVACVVFVKMLQRVFSDCFKFFKSFSACKVIFVVSWLNGRVKGDSVQSAVCDLDEQLLWPRPLLLFYVINTNCINFGMRVADSNVIRCEARMSMKVDGSSFQSRSWERSYDIASFVELMYMNTGCAVYCEKLLNVNLFMRFGSLDTTAPLLQSWGLVVSWFLISRIGVGIVIHNMDARLGNKSCWDMFNDSGKRASNGWVLKWDWMQVVLVRSELYVWKWVALRCAMCYGTISSADRYVLSKEGGCAFNLLDGGLHIRVDYVDMFFKWALFQVIDYFLWLRGRVCCRLLVKGICFDALGLGSLDLVWDLRCDALCLRMVNGKVKRQLRRHSLGGDYARAMLENMLLHFVALPCYFGSFLEGECKRKQGGKHTSVDACYVIIMAIELRIGFRTGMEANVCRDGKHSHHCMVYSLLSLFETPGL